MMTSERGQRRIANALANRNFSQTQYKIARLKRELTPIFFLKTPTDSDESVTA